MKLCCRVRSGKTCLGPLGHDGACEYERITGNSTMPLRITSRIARSLPRTFGTSRGRTKSPLLDRKTKANKGRRETF